MFGPAFSISPAFQSRMFRSYIFLSWKSGPSFSNRVGRSLIHLVLIGPSFTGLAFSVDPRVDVDDTMLKNTAFLYRNIDNCHKSAQCVSASIYVRCHYCLYHLLLHEKVVIWKRLQKYRHRENIGVQALNLFACLFNTPKYDTITSKQLIINYASTFGSLNFGMIIDYFLVAPKFIQSGYRAAWNADAV